MEEDNTFESDRVGRRRRRPDGASIVQLHARVTVQEFESIRRVARQQCKTVSAIVREAIAQFFASLGSSHRD